MYDTHTHLNFKAFKDDYQTVIKNSLKQGMFLNIVGSEFLTSKRAVEIANEFKNDQVYAAVGLHPSHVDTNSKLKTQNAKPQLKTLKLSHHNQERDIYIWSYKKYKELAKQKKVVAIGETGLDYYRATDNHAIQKQIFLEHLKLAADVKKPLIIHCRSSKNTFDGYFDLIDILKSAPQKISQCLNVSISKLSGVIHCFLANWQIAEKFLNLNFYISFTGIITYKNVDDYLTEAIQKIPLDRIMLETDCPYLTPEPARGERNLPINVKYIAQKIAEIKSIDYNKVIKATDENAIRLFSG